MENQQSFFAKLTVTLTHLSRAYLSACDKMLADFGVTQAVAWPALVISRMGDGVRTGVVAAELKLEPSSVVRVIDQLINDGLVERHEDPSDRRARILFLTKKGRDLVEQIELALVSFRYEIFKDIGEGDLDVMMVVLDKLRQSVERYLESHHV